MEVCRRCFDKGTSAELHNSVGARIPPKNHPWRCLHPESSTGHGRCVATPGGAGHSPNPVGPEGDGAQGRILMHEGCAMVHGQPQPCSCPSGCARPRWDASAQLPSGQITGFFTCVHERGGGGKAGEKAGCKMNSASIILKYAC